jgi:hypothetical protein
MKKLLIFVLTVLTVTGLAACGGGGGASPSSDTTQPTVAATDPDDGSTGVAINLTRVTAAFSEEMDASSISETAFTLDNGAAGTVSYDAASKTAVFTLSGELQYNTTYTATVSAEAKDLAGNTLAASHAWSFTTGSAPAPSVPASLTATGSLGNIHLNWDASTGVNLTGYNVYKSTDNAVFTKVNAVPVGATSYDDAIPSPDGDGVFYYYRVTSTGDAESSPSETVKNIHGTRLDANLASGLTTTNILSPYIVEGSVSSEGSVTVSSGTKLYVLDNGSLDILQGNSFVVNGLFRILASAEMHAMLTSHATGTGLDADQGFKITIDGCVDYGSGEGTLFQNAQILNLQTGQAVDISGCKPKFYNLYITANSTYARMDFQATSGAVIQNCSIMNLAPTIWDDHRATGFQMDHNIIAPGPGNYVLDFMFASAGPVDAGQIAYNAFDSGAQIDLAGQTGGAIPLGDNYWQPREPTIRSQNGSTSTVDFTTALSSAPADAGPNW